MAYQSRSRIHYTRIVFIYVCIFKGMGWHGRPSILFFFYDFVYLFFHSIRFSSDNTISATTTRRSAGGEPNNCLRTIFPSVLFRTLCFFTRETHIEKVGPPPPPSSPALCHPHRMMDGCWIFGALQKHTFKITYKQIDWLRAKWNAFNWNLIPSNCEHKFFGFFIFTIFDAHRSTSSTWNTDSCIGIANGSMSFTWRWLSPRLNIPNNAESFEFETCNICGKSCLLFCLLDFIHCGIRFWYSVICARRWHDGLATGSRREETRMATNKTTYFH